MYDVSAEYKRSWRRLADGAAFPGILLVMFVAWNWPMFGAVGLPLLCPLFWFGPRFWDIAQPEYVLSGQGPWPDWWRTHARDGDEGISHRSAGRTIVWLLKCIEMSWVGGWLGLFGLWYAVWQEWRFQLAVAAAVSAFVTGIAIKRWVHRTPNAPRRVRPWLIGLAASTVTLAIPCVLAGFDEFLVFLDRGMANMQTGWETMAMVFLGAPVVAATIVVAGLLFLPRELRFMEEAIERGEVPTAAEALNRSQALHDARLEAAARDDAAGA